MDHGDIGDLVGDTHYHASAMNTNQEKYDRRMADVQALEEYHTNMGQALLHDYYCT